MNELEEQSKKVLDKQKVSSKNFTKQIAFNVIPHIDSFMEDRYTKEEWKMMVETKKILDPRIAFQITSMLEGVVLRGTGKKISSLNFLI